MRNVALASLLIAASAGALAEPLIVENGRLFITARLNDVTTEALLDSGTETSLVDPLLAKAAKLPPGKEIEIKGSGGAQKAHFIYGPHITAGGIDLGEQELVILDLADLLRRLIKRPTRMIAGRQLFDAARLKIDIEGGSWDVLKPGEATTGNVLKLEKHAGIEAITVSVNGQSALADIDLGNGSKPMISKALADKLRLKSVGVEKGGGIGGELSRELVVIPELTVAGKTFRNVEAGVDSLENAGDLNIGTSILRHFVITTDFAGRTVTLDPREAQ